MHVYLLVCLLAQTHDPDEATLSSAKPRIPEPMIFDLVRPLGAARGEVEVNSLLRGTRWAPEAEYTFADGWGVEFELPMQGRTLDSTKAAVQATLPGSVRGRTIHGLQVIWENLVSEAGGQSDALYLFGLRIHPRWSTFHMNGLRRQWNGRETKMGKLANQSVFYQPSQRIVFGIESNYRSRIFAPREILVMPQVHLKFRRLNLQAGQGLRHTDGRLRGEFALRLSREF